jgi:ribosomal protein S17
MRFQQTISLSHSRTTKITIDIEAKHEEYKKVTNYKNNARIASEKIQIQMGLCKY